MGLNLVLKWVQMASDSRRRASVVFVATISDILATLYMYMYVPILSNIYRNGT